MRALLVQPYSRKSLADEFYVNEPIGLEYVGAGLEMDGHEVMIHDTRFDKDLCPSLEQFRPDIVGFTAVSSQVTTVKQYAMEIKEWSPNVFVVVGGHHATVLPSEFNIPQFDLVVIGEGTETMRQVARELERGQSLDNIPGLAFPGDPMRFTEKRSHPPLDTLPLPDRTLSAPYRNRYFNEWFKPAAVLRTSAGCPFRCTFCSIWGTYDGKYLRRSLEPVVEELASIKEPNVYLADDEALLDTKRAHRLADMIREAGIRKDLQCYTRIDTIVDHPDLVEKWRNIGLSTVYVGFEGISDDELDKMKKRITVEQQARAIEILQDLDILVYAQFLVDTDYDYEDFETMIDYVRGSGLEYASFTVLTPLPGSPLYEDRKADITSHDPDLYDVMHAVLPTKLPLPEFYNQYARLFMESIPLELGLRCYYKRYGKYPEKTEGSGQIDRIRNAYLDHS